MSMAQANIKVLNQISKSSPNASACLHPLFGPTFTLYTLYPLFQWYQSFFYWKFFAKVRPEKRDFDHFKGFSMGKKWSKFAKFRKEKKIQIARFLQ
jgi:hypothetical protein